MTKPKTVVSHFIPTQAALMAAMDDFVQNTSYDEPSESTADPEPDVGADTPSSDANVTAAKPAKSAKKFDPTIIQL